MNTSPDLHAQGQRAQEIQQWPSWSKYFDPLTMDAVRISDLLTKDTSYADPRTPKATGPWRLAYTSLVAGQPQTHEVAPYDSHEHGIFHADVLHSEFTVVRLLQKRHYLPRDTVCALSVDHAMWTTILHRFQVLPSFLELVHSNNGGTLAQSSYLQASDTKPSAFHVGYKLGRWGGEEAAIYARRAMSTGHAFVLVLGTDRCLDSARVHQLFMASQDVTVFHVVFSLLSTLLKWAEEMRWEVDYKTQELESSTGISPARRFHAQPLTATQLRFNRGLIVASIDAQALAWGATRVRELFEDLVKHMVQHQGTFQNEHKIRSQTFGSLVEACGLKVALGNAQYSQIQQLQGRLKAQQDFTSTMMAQGDSQLMIDMAEATKRDSKLMRGIAAVTMIFLPATFVATFFSMVFFHVGEEDSVRLMVDRQIWLYPLVSVPLTITIATWYFAWSVSWKPTSVKGILEKIWK